MEWLAKQYLDLRAPAQCGAFHPTQPLFAAAVRNQIIEYDVLTGCKLSSVDIGGPVMKMGYSPAGGHVIVAVLEDLTVRSWDLETEHTYILYANNDLLKKGERPVEVHIALTPIRPWVFFAAHRRSTVNVAGTVEGVRSATKIKTDLKKPITALACHPRQALLYVAYADGIIRAHSIQSFSVVYMLQMEDLAVKLAGAGAIAFHPSLDHIFVGDRTGSLMAWDVSVATRLTLIGFVNLSSEAITAIQWHSTLQLLLTLTRDGVVQGWRVNSIQSRGPFFEQADLNHLDVGRILSQDGRRTVVSVPRVKDLLVHPQYNIATLIFAREGFVEEESGSSLASMSRGSRRELLATLQGARGTPGATQKDKLVTLDAAGLLSEQQLQQQLILHRGQSKITQATAVDYARKAALYGASDRRFSSNSLQSLPLLSIADPIEPLHDLPVCEPFQDELRFFNSEQGIFNYPSRIVLMNGCNLVAYSLAAPDGSIGTLKKLPCTSKSGGERLPRHMVYSRRQQAFLIFLEVRGGPGEVIVYRYLDMNEPFGEGMDTMPGLLGRDGCWTGKHDTQFAILDDDGYGLSIHNLDNPNLPPEVAEEVKAAAPKKDGAREALDEDDFVTKNIYNYGSRFDEETGAEEEEEVKAGPTLFMFDTPVQRIFATPMTGALLYVSAGSHMGLVQAFTDENGRPRGDLVDAGGAAVLNTKRQEGKYVKLQPMEIVLQVRWQSKGDGPVAGVITTQRVMIISARMEVLASNGATFDQGYPPFRSLVWVGPTLFFNTATAVAMLGWDSVVRPLVTIDSPNAVLLGVLNDRVLLASRTAAEGLGSAKGGGLAVKARLLGLLEPLLLGWVTLRQAQGPDPAVDLHDLTLQLTSRFDSQRITPRLVEVLSRGPPVCTDLAVELAQSGPQFTQELRCLCAIRARKFEVALQILKDEHAHSPDYPRCPPTSRLFQRFRELGQACVKYGQFDRAKEVFELVSDQQSQFDLFLAHMNPSALRRLSQHLSETGAEPELRRHCEQVLLVRSAGWSQGAVFANLTGDSLGPRPPEWAGGNWPLKTVPEGSKPSPKWELAGAEVTAYMKTPGGAIPVITPDSIGVYLGTEKGRGVVVEVQEVDSKRFASGLSGRDLLGDSRRPGPAASETDVAAAAAAAFLGTAVELGAARSLLQVQAGAEQEGNEESEEQRRAEAEFKRGFGAAALSSDSDEDDDAASTVSSRSKWQIRIREKSAGAPSLRESIDVQKIALATQSLKLGDLPLAKPPRSSPSNLTLPPASSGFTSPGPASVSSSADSAATPNAAQPPFLAPGPSGAPFRPIWGPAPNENAGKPKQGGVPVQAVALGYAQPQYPPGMPPPLPTAGEAQGGVPLGAAVPVFPYQGQPPSAQGAAQGAMAGQPPQSQSAPRGFFDDDGGQFVAQPPSQGQPSQPMAAFPAPFPPPDAPAYPQQASFISQQGAQQPGLPPPYPTQQQLPLGQEQPASQFGNGVPPRVPPAHPLPSQELELAGGVPPKAPGSAPTPRDEFGGLLSGGAPPHPLQPPAISKSPSARSAPSSTQVLPPGVVDLGSVMRALPGSSQPITATSAAAELGPLAALSTGPADASNAAAAGPPSRVQAGQVPRGVAASASFKAALVHIEENRLPDALACLDESFLALAKDRSLGKDVSTQAKICAHYKAAVLLLQEIARIQKVEGQGAVGAKEEMARLSRHLASLPLQARHRISCMRTAIKRNMEVQNWAYARAQLELLLAKAPPNKQPELRALVNVCAQRGSSDRTIYSNEDAFQFCAQTLGRLPTIGHDTCDTCGSNFSALSSPGCPICGMGIVRRSDASTAGAFTSPF